MKCTNNHKLRLLCFVTIAAVFITGCGSTAVLSNPYSVYSSDYTTSTGSMNYFADSLCVTEDVNYGYDRVSSAYAEAAGVFNLTTKDVTYSQNLFERLYPASTTKVMTAYIILRYGNLDDTVTVSYAASHPDTDSSVCGLKEGDVITVRELLYGLLLVSGNDAAIALAEYYSGNTGSFAKVMNEEAAKLGATGTHFTNPAGLPDENHYTTVYDMYLMFSQAVSLSEFCEIIGTAEYQPTYTHADGTTVDTTWTNTCRYTTGDNTIPDGFTILGGKTGTTKAAGYCLVLYSMNESGDHIISIVYKADTRVHMYQLMSQILNGFAK